MKKKTLNLINLSFLAALSLWAAPSFAMEEENYNQMVPFQAVCHQMILTNTPDNFSYNLNLRLICSWTKKFADEAYDAININGITSQCGNLAINGALRYFLNHFVIKGIGCLNNQTWKFETPENRDRFTFLFNHIDKIKIFSCHQPENNGIVPIPEMTGFKSTGETLSAILTFPETQNRNPGMPFQQIQKAYLTVQRIDELYTQNPQNTPADFPVWNELVRIDPHVTVEDLRKAKISCQMRISEIYQNYSQEIRMPLEVYEESIKPLNQSLYSILRRLIPLLDHSDVNSRPDIEQYLNICSSIQKYEKAYQISLILENELGVALLESMDLLWAFVHTYAHCPSVDPQKLIKFERIFLNKTNSYEPIEVKDDYYAGLLHFYDTRKMHEKIIKLYESKREEMFLTRKFQSYSGDIFHACLSLEQYDLALDVLSHQVVDEGDFSHILNYLNYAITYKAKAAHEAATDYAKKLEEALSFRDTSSGTPQEKLIRLRCKPIIFLLKDDVSGAIQLLNECKEHDKYSLLELVYLSERFNSSEDNIQNLKIQYQELTGEIYEESLQGEAAYHIKILDILTTNISK
jgi:hypothetical protein